MSQWGAWGHIPPWRILFSFYWPDTHLPLISVCLGKALKASPGTEQLSPLFLGWKGRNLSPSEHPGRLCKGSSSLFLVFEVLASCLQQVEEAQEWYKTMWLSMGPFMRRIKTENIQQAFTCSCQCIPPVRRLLLQLRFALKIMQWNKTLWQRPLVQAVGIIL